jgi:hypothetical protein
MTDDEAFAYVNSISGYYSVKGEYDSNNNVINTKNEQLNQYSNDIENTKNKTTLFIIMYIVISIIICIILFFLLL